MLENLRIENIAVIEKADIDFSDGLNILTGETGAGKSVIIDSINAISGQRQSKDIIRTGEEKAEVSALFSSIGEKTKKHLRDLGIETDDSVLLSREIFSNGKSVCRINGKAVTASMLREASFSLIQIVGQQHGRFLLSENNHLEILDSFGDYENLLKKYREQFSELKNIVLEIRQINSQIEQAKKNEELWNYELSEIENAHIEKGQRKKLKLKRNLLEKSREIAKTASEISQLTNGGDLSDGLVELLKNLSTKYFDFSEYDESFKKVGEDIFDMSYRISEYNDRIRNIVDEFENSETELEEIDLRLDKLLKLSMKYGEEEEDILKYAEKLKEKLKNLELSNDKIDLLNQERLKYNELVKKSAQDIERLRIEKSKILESKIMQQLSELDMQNCIFKVNIEKVEYSKNGRNKIEFLISTNKGETLKPLKNIASGGELSRIMLAMQNTISLQDDVSTLIYDEIDTGVSGSAVEKIAIKLKQVSKKSQVIAVTHNAKVASYADNHLYIEKNVKNGRTYTSVKGLDYEEKIKEIARLMGGINQTENQMKTAKEMLYQAEEKNENI
ncbi:MAG: DNA repair protein RecN [Clostridia bacterium]|nr:DNA repair protein RecN [Clostridia bacterium]